jgi:[ribosomal protein S5]-alanine N-acetyltransferase
VTLIPERVDTLRLTLRRPTLADAEAIFSRYASVAEVTRYLIWPTHRTLTETRAFIEGSDRAWSEHGTGPYLVWTRSEVLLGGTGLDLETPYRAETGYVLARDAWGQGYATEAVAAVVSLAFQIPSLCRIHALCHSHNKASARVLEKSGFTLEGLRRRYAVFPNAGSAEPADVFGYARWREGEPPSPPPGM